MDNACIKYLKSAAWWAYFFNIAFKDEILEALTKQISLKIKKSFESYVPNKDNIVFYDSFAFDHRGLTQQYIRALMAQNKNLLFITDAQNNAPISQEIFHELNGYSKAKIIHVPSQISGLKRSQFIYEQIVLFGSSKVLMHLMPNAVEVLVAMHALPKAITRYQVNLTDHTFWLGTTALDYSLEFRPKGMKNSEVGRGIEKSHLLLCPYYPIIDDIPFEGFPFEKKQDDIVVFSGGASYKFVDPKASFAQIIKCVLDENSNAVWVHAGDGMDVIRRLLLEIMDDSYFKRIHLIGVRNDIAEVFNHCDIYCNSFPMGGGLMCLYAAHYGKPMLSLKGNNSGISNIVSQLRQVSLESNNMDELCQEAHKLISDENYRFSRGEEVRSCIVDERWFNETVASLLETNTNILHYTEYEKAELPSMEEKCDYEDRTGECTKKTVGNLRWRSVLLSPLFLRPTCDFYRGKIIRKTHKILHQSQ
jgi:hypothetical protein